MTCLKLINIAYKTVVDLQGDSMSYAIIKVLITLIYGDKYLKECRFSHFWFIYRSILLWHLCVLDLLFITQ